MTNHQAPQQASQHASIRKRNATSWKPGQTGNPYGRAGSPAKQALKAASIAEAEERLCKAILGDLGNDLSPWEAALVKVAAEQLAQAGRAQHGETKVRLTRSAMSLVDRVRSTVTARQPAPSLWGDE